MNPSNKRPRGRVKVAEDKRAVPFSVASQELRIEQVAHQQELQAARLSSAMENVSNALASVQMEVKSCSLRVGEMSRLQSSHDDNRQAIVELRNSFAELNSRLDSWFKSFETEQHQWRARYEKSNEEKRDILERDLRNVRETVIRWGGVMFGLGLLASLVTGVGMYALNQRFDTQSQSILGLRDEFNTYRALTEQRNEERIRKIHEIELYLSRGGRVPEEPYQTQQQRNNNGQQSR